MKSRHVYVKLIAAISISIFLGACQSEPQNTPLPTSVQVPSATASPIPPSPTPTNTSSPTLLPPIPTNTLAPFPEDELSGAQKNEPARNFRPNNIDLPVAFSPFEHFYFSHPVSDADLGARVPSSRYGNDQHAENGAGHTGLDVGLDHGTTIMAAGEGQVIFSGYGLLTAYDNPEDPYGLSIVIQHDFGFDGRPLYSVYAHLSQNLVEVGDQVNRGDEIGRSGDTGFSSGPHIHFEVRVDLNSHANSRNPELWILPKAGEGVLVGRIYSTYGYPVFGQSVKLTNLDTGRTRWAYAYLKTHNITSDNYFDENFVLSEIPAGNYEITVYYVTGRQTIEMEIEAGQVNYFAFNGTNGFDLSWPDFGSAPNIPD